VAQQITHAHGYAPTREAAMAAFAKSWRERRQKDGRGRLLLLFLDSVTPDAPAAAAGWPPDASRRAGGGHISFMRPSSAPTAC